MTTDIEMLMIMRDALPQLKFIALNGTDDEKARSLRALHRMVEEGVSWRIAWDELETNAAQAQTAEA